jgi:hypothetical protein
VSEVLRTISTGNAETRIERARVRLNDGWDILPVVRYVIGQLKSAPASTQYGDVKFLKQYRNMTSKMVLRGVLTYTNYGESSARVRESSETLALN